MLTPDPVMQRQIPVIQKIVADETWLEGERRGCFVASSDRVVRERVCEVVLRIGQQMRDTFSRQHGLSSATDANPDGLRPASVTNVCDGRA